MSRWIIGIDEVGRGPIAGPVMVCACAIREEDLKLLDCVWIRDSKVLSRGRRKSVFEELEIMAAAGIIRYAVAAEEASIIDAIGIVPAIRRCIADALAAVDVPAGRAYIYLDGGLRAPAAWSQSTHIKGDRDFKIISAASIIAKVVRDEYMAELALQFPGYDWEINAGYGTRGHYDAIARHGITEIHRKSFLKKVLDL